MSNLLRYFILVALLCTSCTPKSETELSKALAAAVKDQKISEQKVKSILNEFDMLRDMDREKAGQFADKIINAIQMGGDSSHIQVVRNEFAPIRQGV